MTMPCNKKFLGVQNPFSKKGSGKTDENQEEPPPVLKSWKNLYLVVLGNLLFWIALFTFFTWTYQ